jgi:hypothetical protein
MLGGLRGKAAKFLEIKPELMNMTPQEVNTIFEKKFGQASIRNLLDLNTIQQKPAESVMEYAARLRTAAEYLQDNLKDVIIVKKEDLDKYDTTKQRVWTQEEFDLKVETVRENLERLLVPFFIDGLRPNLKDMLMSKVPQPPTLTEAVEYAEARETHAEAFKRFRSSTISNLEGDANIVKEAAEQLQSLNMSSNRPPSQRQPYHREDRRCFNCGKEGHLARNCRQPRRATPMTKKTSNGSNIQQAHLQSGLRGLRGSSNPRYQPPSARDPGEPRFNSTAQRKVQFKQQDGEAKGYTNRRDPPRYPNRKTYERQNIAAGEEKNGVRPPLQGGLKFPSPILRDGGKPRQNKALFH